MPNIFVSFEHKGMLGDWAQKLMFCRTFLALRP